MSQYYIFHFNDNDAGNQMRFNLAGYPNGTPFSNFPLYVNSKKDVWIVYPDTNNLQLILSSIRWITKDGGVEVIPTNVTEVIPFPQDIEKLKEYDKENVEKFRRFAPHLCFD